MATTSTFGQLIRERRLAKGMSMGQLASSVDRTAASVRRWERDEVVPGSEVVERLAGVLDLDAAELAASAARDAIDDEAGPDVGAGDTATAVAAQPMPPAEVEPSPPAQTDALPVAVPPPLPPPASPPVTAGAPPSAATTLSPEVDAPPVEERRTVRYYLDHLFDPDRPYLGYVRATLTVVVGVVLLWILIVAAGSLLDALGDVWDQFDREETGTTVAAAAVRWL